MKISKPAYYDRFRCIASSCPDSCCKEWVVQIDDTSAKLYRDLSGPLGDALRNAMIQEDGNTLLTLTQDKRCPMWQPDGLCRIQSELGETALCQTCRDFPRLRHDYGNLVELGLELSCPEAAKWILTGDDYIITDHSSCDIVPEYDIEAMALLLRTRNTILNYLSRTANSVGESLAILLVYGHAVQDELDGGPEAILDPCAALQDAEKLATNGNVAVLLEFFSSLEILTSRWHTRLTAPNNAKWNELHRAMARYFVSRYWLQAVSDYDLISRVKLTVVSCLLVKLLGGNTIETAQLYSKEIENNIDNVDAILDAAYVSPVLADGFLIDLLLRE